jgi:DNA-directed RNA polymerase specialized sigma24 family protein
MTREDASEKFLDGHTLGPNLQNSLRNPVWRDGAMTSARSPLNQLSDHLALVARTPEGRQLFGDLRTAGLTPAGAVDLRGVLDPRNVTSALQRADLVEWLARWAAEDHASALTMLALLRPELGVIAGRLARGGVPAAEAEGEALVAAWEVVASRSEATGAARLETIWTRARTATGLRRTCPVEDVALPEGFDAADPESDLTERSPSLLAASVAAGALTPRQVVIVASTRLEGSSVAQVAKALGRPCWAVYKERQRAEKALRAFARSYGSSGSR